MKNRN